jgi:hypothetical protein
MLDVAFGQTLVEVRFLKPCIPKKISLYCEVPNFVALRVTYVFSIDHISICVRYLIFK